MLFPPFSAFLNKERWKSRFWPAFRGWSKYTAVNNIKFENKIIFLSLLTNLIATLTLGYFYNSCWLMMALSNQCSRFVQLISYQLQGSMPSLTNFSAFFETREVKNAATISTCATSVHRRAHRKLIHLIIFLIVP